MVKSKDMCESNVIASYIDGELAEVARERFEQHIVECDNCRDELNAHRMFLCELDAAMSQPMDVAVPRDFSRIVAARAESDMSGMRSRSEHKKAFGFCIILALLAFALIGAGVRDSLIELVRSLVAICFGVIGFLWTAFYDAVASITVISRNLSRKLVIETGSLGLLAVLLALAILLLSRLIFNYHRTGATE